MSNLSASSLRFALSLSLFSRRKGLDFFLSLTTTTTATTANHSTDVQSDYSDAKNPLKGNLSAEEID